MRLLSRIRRPLRLFILLVEGLPRVIKPHFPLFPVFWVWGLMAGDWYTVWPMVEPDLFSLQDEKKHGARRRNVAHAYSLATLLGMEEFVDQCSTLLLREFAKFARNKEVVDIAPWMQYYAFDVVGELGLAQVLMHANERVWEKVWVH